MLRNSLMLIVLTFLFGCMTPQERAERVQFEVEQMVKLYGPACDKLGFGKDTDPWRECILHLQAHDDERYRTRPITTSCIGHRGFYNCTSF